MADNTEPKNKCPKCGLKALRFRVDGTAHCQKCGYDSRKKE